MIQLRKSIGITFLSTNIATVVQFVVTLILARLLTPTEIGIFSIAAVAMNLASVFRDFGVQNYLQQEKDLSREKIRSALGLLLTTSWLLALVVYFVRWPVARYYNEPGIADLMAVMAISFLLVPIASFFHAILARDLQAGKQAVVHTVSTAAYAITCLVLAYAGFSYMSLAWANVANLAFTVLAYLYFYDGSFSLKPSLKGWRAPLRFGVGSAISNLATQANNSLPDLFLGKVSGAYSVGIYSRAQGFIGIFAQVAGPTLNYITLPFLARSHHDNKPIGDILEKATCFLTVIAWPFFIGMALNADDLIMLLYGAQWTEAVPIAVIIAVHAALRVSTQLYQPALVAIGRPMVAAIPAVINFALRLVFALAFGMDSILHFAIAICAADVFGIIVPMILMSKFFKFSFSRALGVYLQAFVFSLLFGAVALAVKYALPSGMHLYMRVASTFFILAFSWLLIAVLTKHPIAEEIRRFLPARYLKFKS
jgi:O-antigen/teichoic acid export membrane protein